MKTNEYFRGELLIKRYEVPNLLLYDEPIMTYREVNKKQRFKIGRREVRIRTVNKRERTHSFFHLFR